jgi:hypothetical protein
MFHFKTLLNSLGNVLIHQIILDSMLITSHSPFLAYYYFVSGKKKKKKKKNSLCPSREDKCQVMGKISLYPSCEDKT